MDNAVIDMYAVCLISAAVGLKFSVTLISMFTNCTISAAVQQKLIVIPILI